MKKHVDIILKEFLIGNEEPLRKSINLIIDKDNKSIADELKENDFIFYWNKAFISAYDNNEIELEKFPTEIERLPMVWLSYFINNIEDNSKKVKTINNIKKSFLDKQLTKLMLVFKFLDVNIYEFNNLQKHLLVKYQLNKEQINNSINKGMIDYSEEDKKKAEISSMVIMFFLLSKIKYYNDEKVRTSDLSDILKNLLIGETIQKIINLNDLDDVKSLVFLNLMDHKKLLNVEICNVFKVFKDEKIKNDINTMLSTLENNYLDSFLEKKKSTKMAKIKV